MSKQFKTSKAAIKHARDKMLRLHKVLMDWDRATYEKEHGAVSPGKFLEMLLGDERFAWLRVLSTLIVRIDESFDLDDGVSNQMLEGYRQEMKDIFDYQNEEYLEFKENFRRAAPLLPEAVELRDEILQSVNWDGR